MPSQVSPRTRIPVRVRPGASRAAVGGRYEGVRGPALVVAVRERAVEGRANEAVLRSLADALGVRRADVRLVTGTRGRDKVVTVDDPEGSVGRRVQALLDGHPPS